MKKPIINLGETKVKISTSNNSIANTIKRHIQGEVINPWLTGIRLATEAASEKFVSMLAKTEVIKSLNNDYQGKPGGIDLPAEFGLYREESENDIVPKILEVAKGSFGAVEAGGNIDRARTIFGVINIGLNTDYADRLLKEVPKAEYESQNGVVPWMQWLLTGSAENGNYGILYFPKGLPQYFIRKGIESRSGNALMTKASSWFWNADVLGVYGNNFVEDVMTNPKNMAILNKEIIKAMKQAFSRFSKYKEIPSNAIVVS